MLARFMILVALIASILSYAEGEISVRGSVSPISSQYYTADIGTFEVTFRAGLTPVETVALRYAYAGRGADAKTVDWANEDVVEMTKVSPGVFKAVFADLVAARGALRYKKLNFVFIVRASKHERSVQNGTRSALGHYQVDVPFGAKETTELAVETVEK